MGRAVGRWHSAQPTNYQLDAGRWALGPAADWAGQAAAERESTRSEADIGNVMFGVATVLE